MTSKNESAVLLNSTDGIGNNETNMSTMNSCEQLLAVVETYDEFFQEGGQSSPIVGRLIVALYVCVITWGVIGNALTIVATLKKSSVASSNAARNDRNLFITNLALSDFFLCIVTTPLTLYTILHIFWPFGEMACKLCSACFAFTVFLSTMNVSAIGFDRFLAIISPTTITQNRRAAIGMLIVVWLFAAILAVPIFYTAGLVDVYVNKPCGVRLQVCWEIEHKWAHIAIGKKFYTSLTCVFQYALPLCVLCFVYAMISDKLRNRMNNRTNLGYSMNDEKRRVSRRRQQRTYMLLLGIVVVFACSWLPFNVFMHLFMYEYIQFSVPAYAFTHIVAMTSACSNPVLYGVLNDNIRREFVAILSSLNLMPILKLIFGKCACCCQFQDESMEERTTITPRSRLERRPMASATIVRKIRSVKQSRRCSLDPKMMSTCNAPQTNGHALVKQPYRTGLAVYRTSHDRLETVVESAHDENGILLRSNSDAATTVKPVTTSRLLDTPTTSDVGLSNNDFSNNEDLARSTCDYEVISTGYLEPPSYESNSETLL